VTVKLQKGFARGEGWDRPRNIQLSRGPSFGANIVGSTYIVKIVDTSFRELLVGGGGRLRGLQGPDEIYGGSWGDTLLGANGVVGNDYLRGVEGVDTCIRCE
jgi:Ca2+-binding RTX toxin-like protein